MKKENLDNYHKERNIYDIFFIKAGTKFLIYFDKERLIKRFKKSLLY